MNCLLDGEAYEMTYLVRTVISKNASIQLNLREHLPPITADATQIRQVVMNFITNASDAIGDENGVISLTTGLVEVDDEYLATLHASEDLDSGPYVYIEISDTGCGITTETQEKMFDPFFSNKGPGRGPGLAATLGIIRVHNGAVKVYSEVGQGTAVKVLLPASKQSIDSENVRTTALTDWRGTGTVLIVDDEVLVRSVLESTVEYAGFDVVTAKDGLEGLALYEELQGEIVLVILDLTMPQMGGNELFRRLRQIRPDVRVILTSGYNEQDVINGFTEKGLAGFIQKPFEPEELIQKICEIMAVPRSGDNES